MKINFSSRYVLPCNLQVYYSSLNLLCLSAAVVFATRCKLYNATFLFISTPQLAGTTFFHRTDCDENILLHTLSMKTVKNRKIFTSHVVCWTWVFYKLSFIGTHDGEHFLELSHTMCHFEAPFHVEIYNFYRNSIYFCSNFTKLGNQ